MIVIDGSMGEGGGQILRTALALSLVTGEAFRIQNIRAGRKKPGLLRQHLTAVQAAMQIGKAKVQGMELNSQELLFKPGGIQPGQYHFAVGTAGSATLVLQTVLPALMLGTEPSTLSLEGGTHNPHAPPFDFLRQAFLPLLNRMGPVLTATLDRPGFYPAGGGKFEVTIQPASALGKLELINRGPIKRRLARAVVANLPKNVAQRELKVIAEQLNWSSDCLVVEELKNSCGPGNVLSVELEGEWGTEVFTGFGERGLLAEAVASSVVKKVREYLAAEVPVGSQLADQLLLPMAIAGSGCFKTMAPSRHLLTNLDVIEAFLPGRLHLEKCTDHWMLTCGQEKFLPKR